ncbi:unnamed protein product [Hymenolepis diminuta]|uniref:Uncharacterized protein n=1 Tax=Hymenolepis diminuta TaxID=6216 RepID=A0A3P6ZHY8_HYMDI|nr:unnamed protein product [Hymenolepis diminuta]
MESFENGLIIGGENLLEKAESQTRLLDNNAVELDAQEHKTDALRKRLRKKSEQRVNIEEEYNSLLVMQISFNSFDSEGQPTSRSAVQNQHNSIATF